MFDRLLREHHIWLSSISPVVLAQLTKRSIASRIATHLDLNSLHELSRTCRQFRANLLQYRDQLIEHSLRCENENANPAVRLGNALNASHHVWAAYGREGVKIGRITSGKVGACARDLVGHCRRCSKVVCRVRASRWLEVVK